MGISALSLQRTLSKAQGHVSTAFEALGEQHRYVNTTTAGAAITRADELLAKLPYAPRHGSTSPKLGGQIDDIRHMLQVAAHETAGGRDASPALARDHVERASRLLESVFEELFAVQQPLPKATTKLLGL
ncbi:MAG: hypothetical protein JWN41_1500 [Thermoleophilia bacterium]|nr:hypothetical protein [Thermoleophilia bacterium]